MFALKHVGHVYGSRLVLDLPEYIEANPGEKWLLHGPSGSGKTTLLHIIAGLLKPSQGSVHIAEQDIYALTETARDRFRGQRIGIVFQQFHLLPVFTVLENLLMAHYMAGVQQDKTHVQQVLATLGLAGREHAYPSELSFGQQQRVAIARAVINRPQLLLADEPTSGLDDTRSEQVLDLLTSSAREVEATLVVASHDHRITDSFDHCIALDEQMELPA